MNNLEFIIFALEALKSLKKRNFKTCVYIVNYSNKMSGEILEIPLIKWKFYYLQQIWFYACFLFFSPAGIYLLKVNCRNTRARCEICSKLKIKTSEWCHWQCSVVFIVNFEHISHLVLVFQFLTLSIKMSVGSIHTIYVCIILMTHSLSTNLIENFEHQKIVLLVFV